MTNEGVVIMGTEKIEMIEEGKENTKISVAAILQVEDTNTMTDTKKRKVVDLQKNTEHLEERVRKIEQMEM